MGLRFGFGFYNVSIPTKLMNSFYSRLIFIVLPVLSNYPSSTHVIVLNAALSRPSASIPKSRVSFPKTGLLFSK